MSLLPWQAHRTLPFPGSYQWRGEQPFIMGMPKTLNRRYGLGDPLDVE